MLAYGNTTYGYTANGSLTTKISVTDTTHYQYDLLGNLISVTLPNGDFTEYLIDGQNRRVGKVVNGVFKKGWLYQDQLNPVAELDSTGQVSARFVYGSKAHVPDYIIRGDSTYRVITDHLGSVRLIVNTETGSIAQQLSYDEFGNVLLNTSSDFQPFAYAGGLYDSQTGFVRFGARDYDARVGRWTSKEPLKFYDGNNLFLYCHNSPIQYNDIYGLWTLQFGVSGSLGLRWGGTLGGGVIFGYNESSGFQFGFYTVMGTGPHIGGSASIVAEGTHSLNPCIEDVSGVAGTIGGSGQLGLGPSIGGEANIPFDNSKKPSITFGAGKGIGTPEGHTYITFTDVSLVSG